MYTPSPCAGLIKEFTNALIILNTLQEKVPEEIEDAVGRLRDRFQFLPGEMKTILPSVDLQEKTFVKEASDEAVAAIDELRELMDKHGTTKVLEYTSSNTKNDLKKIITNLQASILREANENLSACFCYSVCPRE